MKLLDYVRLHSDISRRDFFFCIQNNLVYIGDRVIQDSKYRLSEADIGQTLEINADFVHLCHNIVYIPDNKPSNILLYHKPKGYVVSRADPDNKTVYNILPIQYQKYYYIGRLDKDSTGLLLFTNDPAMVHRYSHPSFDISKTYIVGIDMIINPNDSAKLLQGQYCDGDLLRFVDIQILAKVDYQKYPNYKFNLDVYYYQVVLSDGKNRHIKRLINALGYHCMSIHRVNFGDWSLGDITLGQYKILDL